MADRYGPMAAGLLMSASALGLTAWQWIEFVWHVGRLPHCGELLARALGMGF